MSELVIEVRIQIPEGATVKVAPGPATTRTAGGTWTPEEGMKPTPAQIEDGDFGTWSTKEAAMVYEQPLPPWPSEGPVEAPAETYVADAPAAPPGGHHGKPWRLVPGGWSKRTGKAFTSFWTCAEPGCNEKPPR